MTPRLDGRAESPPAARRAAPAVTQRGPQTRLLRRTALLGVAATLVILSVVLFAAFGCRGGPPAPKGTAGIEWRLVETLGGDTTAFITTRNSFGLPARNLSPEQRRTFAVGNSFFRQNWVTAPASTAARDGLGPTFNALSCSSCHHLDGRGKPPDDAHDGQRGLLIRLSLPGHTAQGGPVPEPVYGGQLQDRGIVGVPAEGEFTIVYREVAGAFDDGETYSLRQPTYQFHNLAFGPMRPETLSSPRVAPAIVGMGLLEAIPEANLLAAADPDDSDGDGISGRANMVWDLSSGALTLGRFGWKANQPSVEQQTAGAFLGDLGITSPVFPAKNCTSAQTDCLAAPHGGAPEIPAERLAKVVLYTQTLAVPAMRDPGDPQVERGARLFAGAGCALCHTPKHTTGQHPVEAASNQTIYPYTDLLLHDMGPGLTDGRPDFDAGGQEWRTPPLWGIGLVETVNGHTMFLHDGRARSLSEAILWHGGEGAGARGAFKALTKEERQALIRFLESL